MKDDSIKMKTKLTVKTPDGFDYKCQLTGQCQEEMAHEQKLHIQYVNDRFEISQRSGYKSHNTELPSSIFSQSVLCKKNA